MLGYYAFDKSKKTIRKVRDIYYKEDNTVRRVVYWTKFGLTASVKEINEIELLKIINLPSVNNEFLYDGAIVSFKDSELNKKKFYNGECYDGSDKLWVCEYNADNFKWEFLLYTNSSMKYLYAAMGVAIEHKYQFKIVGNRYNLTKEVEEGLNENS